MPDEPAKNEETNKRHTHSCHPRRATTTLPAVVLMIGTVVDVGPVELDTHDTTYDYLAIRDQADTLRQFKMVRAIPEVSGLVHQRDASGAFVLLDSPTECRLALVYLDEGARAADFDALRGYIEEAVDPTPAA